MQRRTKKHQSKRQRNAEMGLGENGEEKLVTFKNALLLCNALIETGSGDIERSISTMQQISDQLGKKKHIVACCYCAKKLGIKKCSACPKDSKVRYCSRNCQLEAWPTHKELCGVLEAEDVE